MTTADFAKSLREKYPDGVTNDGISYSTMSDEDLVGRVVQKYPVYKSQIDDLPNGGILESVGGAIKEFGTDIATSINERSSNIKDAVIPKDQEAAQKMAGGGVGRPILRVAGQIAAGIGDVEMAALKLVAPKFVEDLASKGINKLSNTEFVQTISEKIDQFKQAHPEASQDIEDITNILAIIPELKAGQALVKGGQKTVGAVSKVTGEALDAVRTARIAKASEEVDSVVGKIVQGSTKDIEKAKKALSSINTVGVKTYEDLGARLNDGIEALSNKVDDILEKEGATVGPLKADKLVTVTKVGEKEVKQNFVQDALNQMDEMYQSIKDAPGQARIADIKKKLESEGLTVKEVNDLSRDYNREFGKKAFSPKTGDALTSVNAQAYENTRKGIKNVARSFMPDDTVKMLDERMSDMFNTNRLVGKMEEKVNSLYQKAQKRGILEKIARGTADVVNAATFNTLSGFVSRLLPSNVGLKVMNSIDLENALSKNLSKIEKLLKTSNDSVLKDGILELVKGAKTNP